MRGLYLVSVWLHVLAAMTWLGGMVIFLAAVMPYFRSRPESERAAFLEWFGRRFRTVAWTCFSILAVTGTFNLWARGVRVEDFFRPEWHRTAFGRLVLLKLGLVAVAMVVSAAHERQMLRHHARWMGRSLLVIGLAILAAAIALVRAI